jgi:phage terminase Nu1 subunit (DNA packaging protein)
MTDNGVLLTRDELRELTEIRLAVDSVQRMLDAAMQADDVSVSDAASVLQPIARRIAEFTDRVYKRAG